MFDYRQRTGFQPVEDQYCCLVAIYRSLAWFAESDEHLKWSDNLQLVSVKCISTSATLQKKPQSSSLTCAGVVNPCMKFCILVRAFVAGPLEVVVVRDMS